MKLPDYFKNHEIRLLAKRSGISESTIRRYRDGDTKITLANAYKIQAASYGKVGLWDLLTEEDVAAIRKVEDTMGNLNTTKVIEYNGEDLL